MKPKDFLNQIDDRSVAEAIGAAEKRTSGEIRVFVSEKEIGDPVTEAQKQFFRLGMNKTTERNAVLLYFAPLSQTFAIIGDEAIHRKCGQPFWHEVTEAMTPMLKGGKFTEAIVHGVEKVGATLAKEFPYRNDDRNELPNSVERDPK